MSTARDRRSGFEAALEAAGIPLDPALVVEASVDALGGSDGMRTLLALEERPTAVFTVNNLVAVGAIESVRAAGLEVPDDVALVCFDDIEYASRLYPFLTAMEQPAETFGTLSTQLLLERIDHRGPERPRVVVLPANFVVRRSCGARRAPQTRVIVFGGIETGGSKWQCAIGTGPDDLRATATFPTTTPAETIGLAAAFFEREGPVAALGIGSFGPLDADVGSPTWGHVTTTPKPGGRTRTSARRSVGGSRFRSHSTRM